MRDHLLHSSRRKASLVSNWCCCSVYVRGKKKTRAAIQELVTAKGCTYIQWPVAKGRRLLRLSDETTKWKTRNRTKWKSLVKTLTPGTVEAVGVARLRACWGQQRVKLRWSWKLFELYERSRRGRSCGCLLSPAMCKSEKTTNVYKRLQKTRSPGEWWLRA